MLKMPLVQLLAEEAQEPSQRMILQLLLHWLGSGLGSVTVQWSDWVQLYWLQFVPTV
jgi:hypothetical protein